jgi:cobalt-zinc-cadmium efflux system outer membrane protein
MNTKILIPAALVAVAVLVGFLILGFLDTEKPGAAASEREEGGIVSESVEVEYADISGSIPEAGSDVAVQQALIGAPSKGGELNLSGKASELPTLPSEVALLSRLDNVPQVRLARVEIDLQEANVSVEKSRRLPDLTISLGSQYSSMERERVNLVGLSLPLPLFDRNQGNLLAASRRADQARDLRNATLLRLRSEVQQAYQQWRTATGAISSFEAGLLASADKDLENTTRGFQMGKFGLIDVLDAQRTSIDVRSRYLQALAEALDAWVRLERIYGDLSTQVDSD